MYAPEETAQYSVQASNPRLGQVVGSPVPVREPSPVDRLVHQICEAQNKTHSLITDLEDRLRNVLEARAEVGASANQIKPAYGSALCQELDNRLSMELSAQTRLLLILEALVV